MICLKLICVFLLSFCSHLAAFSLRLVLDTTPCLSPHTVSACVCVLWIAACACVCSFMQAHTCHLFGIDMPPFTDPVYEQPSVLNPAKCCLMWTTVAILPNKIPIISFQKVKQMINPYLPLWNYKLWIMSIHPVTRGRQIKITCIIAQIGQNMKWKYNGLPFLSHKYYCSFLSTGNVPAVPFDIHVLCKFLIDSG